MPPEIVRDGVLLVDTFVAPGRALPAAAGRCRPAVALLAATAAALLFTAIALPRVDFERRAAATLERRPDGTELTAHEREEALKRAAKIGAVGAWASAALGPTLLALGAAAALWVGFRVAGARPGFRPTFAVVAQGMLPARLAPLLAIPAVVASAPVPAEDLHRLLPSSLAALLTPSAPPALAAALGGVDLFALWSAALVASGMARAAGTSRRRAVAVTAVLYVAAIALLHVVPSALPGATPP